MLTRIICVKWQYLKPFNCVQIKQYALDGSDWNHFTKYKQMSSGSFKNNITYKLFFNKSNIFNLYKYEQDLIVNNL